MAEPHVDKWNEIQLTLSAMAANLHCAVGRAIDSAGDASTAQWRFAEIDIKHMDEWMELVTSARMRLNELWPDLRE